MDRYRTIQLGLALALIAVIAVAVAFGSGGADGVARPNVIEDLSPQPGDLVARQSLIEIDMPVGYRIELWVQINSTAGTWQRIPDTEISFQEGTGIYTWSPAPGRVIETWEPGSHRLRLTWDTIVGLPDVGQYEWEFRST